MQLSERIIVDPKVRFGKPTVRGTRITVADVLSFLASGLTPQQVTITYPALTEADVLACLAFAADQDHGLRQTSHPSPIASQLLDSQQHAFAE